MSSYLSIPITAHLQMEITNLLNMEAYYLDNGKYKEWLDLLSDDLTYRMPLRETLEGVGANNVSKDASFFEETKKSLTTRVNRLYTKSAWVENPATRQRHFISNIMVESTKNPEEFKVRSYFLFKRSRGSTHDIEEMFGERNDIVRKESNQWKIASRTILPDQSVITTMNMSMFL
ncbi:3-phenylpropionate/cinnamic acid dioxygenase subunit beta [Bacillus sp. CMF12]|uniref:3-phenylpropionate/cinnamic acid dioxygenase subunit beta n=1 Tax=Bacillaceae TaxID=186817 RepID=UPI001FB2ADB8|nr:MULTISPECIES: 3-phenylpropionate/cinnamic acid dioxygenase subunit beta [Bacillaceae]MDF2039388.1 3-phenylpropionate/cinnamic acid dioxygenase subunit beta [Cytobacillus oceanisediminis]UOE56847.1 3-phenylpropionate/cinnamic acid dioxygenase subunit beta [Cytobacillus oceanisediminis]USK51339.1 3-phenylpropionate/cinnamic acid dioxygenase subunit beta [Bacillus sp. CMF12]